MKTSSLISFFKYFKLVPTLSICFLFFISIYFGIVVKKRITFRQSLIYILLFLFQGSTGRRWSNITMETDEFSEAVAALRMTILPLHPHLLPSEMWLEGRRGGRRRKELVDRGELIAKTDKFGAVEWNSYWHVLVYLPAWEIYGGSPILHSKVAEVNLNFINFKHLSNYFLCMQEHFSFLIA